LGLFSPEKRRLCGDLILAFQYLNGAYKKDGDKFFSRAHCNRTRGNIFKLRKGRFRLDIRNNFFSVRIAKHWNRLPREVVDASSLKNLQGQVGQGSEQPDLVVDVPVITGVMD